MKKTIQNIILIMMILIACTGTNLFAQSNLNTFKNGDIISAGEMNANFEMLMKMVKELQKNIVPSGTIMAYSGDLKNIPLGWLLCDGSQYTRSQYPELHNAISAALKNGDNFNVPDLRGVVLRGIDVNKNGKTSGKDPEGIRKVGKYQADAFKSHQHTYTDSYVSKDSNEVSSGSKHRVKWGDRTLSTNKNSDGGAAETRSKNVSVYYIIKL